MARQTRRKTVGQMRRQRRILLRILAFVVLVLLACLPLYFLVVRGYTPSGQPYMDIGAGH